MPAIDRTISPDPKRRLAAIRPPLRVFGIASLLAAILALALAGPSPAAWLLAILAGPLWLYAYERDRHAARTAAAREEQLAALDLRDRAMNAAGIVAITDRKGKITHANDRFCELSGYTREELIGQDHRIVNSGYHPKAFFKDMYATLAKGQTWRGEVKNRAKDGSHYWVDTTIFPMHDLRGERMGYMALRIDITETKRAHQELDLAQRLIDEASVMAKIGGWSINLDTMTPIWSDEVFRIHEVEIGKQPPLEEAINFYAPEARDTIRNAVANAIRTGKGWDLELPFITAKGRRLWIRTIGRTEMVEGKCVRLWGGFQDITAQHQAQAEHLALARRLAAAVDGAGVGVWEYNPTDQSMIWDRTMHRIFGLNHQDQAHTFASWLEAIHENDRAIVQSLLTECLRTGERFKTNFRIIRPDGEQRHVAVSANIEQGTSPDEPTRVVGVHADVTDEFIATEQLQQARLEAEAANRSKSEFLANMSHEIRTPMTAMVGYAELLDDDFAHDADAIAQATSAIRVNAHHLLALINDILDVSKVDAGRITIERLPVSPEDIVRQAASLLEPKANERDIDLNIDIDEHLPAAVVTDPTRLRQILINLIGNAIKFTRHGSVNVRVQQGKDPGALSFRVADTGIGMTPEQLAHISRFEAFAQADGSTTRRFGGTGLGLRISSALAELLGGSISIESEPDKGSVFTLSIHAPIAQSTAPTTPDSRTHEDDNNADRQTVDRQAVDRQAATQETRPLAGANILLAEDGLDNQRLISFMLTKAGANITTVSNGRLAVESVELSNKPFDLILMDMQMPELDGYDATKLLRTQGHTLPVIALTAHAMAGDRAKCIDAGCNEYLTKPIDRAKLIRTCNAFVQATAQPGATPHAA
ncbi:MAG: PAS domain-containing protein [Planctomycetota bacterium]